MKRWIHVLMPVLVFAAALPAAAALLHDIPVTLHQPDGTAVPCFMSGDEYFRWAHDARGFVIIDDPADGRLVYAAARDGRWVPTAWVVGSVDPVAVGLTPRLPIPAEALRRGARIARDHAAKGRPADQGGPKTGQFNNIVIFLRFQDQTAFPEQIGHYSDMFNSNAAGANSMTNYYEEVSYGQLSVTTSLFPLSSTSVLSYQDSRQRGYYSPRSLTNPAGYDTTNYSAEGYVRLHTMLKAAVNYVAAQVPADLDIDRDGDGLVDNVCFIARGTSDTWYDLLWPHMWHLVDDTEHPAVYIHDKQVYTYNFQLADILNLPQIGNGVLCHEMFHSLGAPDLYRYFEGNGTFSPVGAWDLMEDNGNPPQHMLTYMKYQYGGWISSLPVISVSGNYTLQPVTSPTNNCYRINSPNTAGQYFVVEYRRQASSIFEAQVPGSGLIVYRINTAVTDGSGNMNGPPDEVYVYCPRGTNTETGSKDEAFYNATVGRTSITDQTSPSAFLADGQPGGLKITAIGAATGTITFTVTIDGGAVSCATLAGDATGDNRVNITDLVATVNDILQTQPLAPGARACADQVAPFGTVDILDLLAIVDLILHPDSPGLAVESEAGGSTPLALSLRAQRAAGEWRLTFDGSTVAGMQAELPFEMMPASNPRLEGGAPDVNVDWDFRGGKLRLLAYASDGGVLAPGACTLILPARASAVAGSDGVVDDEDLVLDGALQLSSAPALFFADARGQALPFVFTAAAGPSTSVSSAQVVAVEPNPTRGAVRLRLVGISPGSAVSMQACDAAGRIVAGFTVPPPAVDGSVVAEWDGRDFHGRPLPTGVYFLLPEGVARGSGAKLLMVR
jgi:M6 family metalloprotease-like protein